MYGEDTTLNKRKRAKGKEERIKGEANRKKGEKSKGNIRYGGLGRKGAG